MSRILVPLTITLALVGLAVTLVNDPLRLVRTVMIAAVFIAVFYFIYKFFFQKKTSKVDSKYQRAAKQSRKLQQQKQKARNKSAHLKVIKSGRKRLGNKTNQTKQNKEHNLTVIEGKKSKKKNRALF